MRNESSSPSRMTTNSHSFRMIEPEEIDALRPFLTEGFSCLQGLMKCEKFLEDMEHSIYVGATAVFIAEMPDTNKPYAFFTVEFDMSSGEAVAVVSSAYSPLFNKEDILEAGMAVAIDFAKGVNVKKVRFSSPRKAWLRRAPDLGARLVELTFELEA